MISSSFLHHWFSLNNQLAVSCHHDNQSVGYSGTTGKDNIHCSIIQAALCCRCGQRAEGEGASESSHPVGG